MQTEATKMANRDRETVSTMITMKPTETQLTLLLLLLPVVFLILLVVGVMSPQKIQQACL